MEPAATPFIVNQIHDLANDKARVSSKPHSKPHNRLSTEFSAENKNHCSKAEVLGKQLKDDIRIETEV